MVLITGMVLLGISHLYVASQFSVALVSSRLTCRQGIQTTHIRNGTTIDARKFYFNRFYFSRLLRCLVIADISQCRVLAPVQVREQTGHTILRHGTAVDIRTHKTDEKAQLSEDSAFSPEVIWQCCLSMAV